MKWNHLKITVSEYAVKGLYYSFKFVVCDLCVRTRKRIRSFSVCFAHIVNVDAKVQRILAHNVLQLNFSALEKVTVPK